MVKSALVRRRKLIFGPFKGEEEIVMYWTFIETDCGGFDVIAAPDESFDDAKKWVDKPFRLNKAYGIYDDVENRFVYAREL